MCEFSQGHIRLARFCADVLGLSPVAGKSVVG
jgi:hypothetical protein